MRIAVCSPNVCTRCSQTSLVAKEAGHEIHLVTHHGSVHRQFNERFNSVAAFQSQEQMLTAIGNIDPDLIHIQDRPHRIAYDILTADWDCPVVYDMHDFASQMVPGRVHPGDEGEWWAVRRASALVFVSEGHKRYAEKVLGATQPSAVVPSMVKAEFFPKRRSTHLGAAIWEGGLFTEPDDSPRLYIDQRDIIRRFELIGQVAVLHPALANDDLVQAYAAVGAFLHSPQMYPTLMAELSRYDFGWYGQTLDHDQVHETLPNKMFEMIAAGLPVLVINAREAGKFVEKHGVGIHVRRPEDLIYVKKDLLALRGKMWERRHEFTREKACESLWPLYERLTGKCGRPHAA